MTVVIPCFYPIKTINKALFWEGNPQTYSDLGTNNLVPHVLVIIWLQVLKTGIFSIRKLHMKVGQPTKYGQMKNQLHNHQYHSFWRHCAKDGHSGWVGRPQHCGVSTTIVLRIASSSYLQKMDLWFHQRWVDRPTHEAISAIARHPGSSQHNTKQVPPFDHKCVSSQW